MISLLNKSILASATLHLSILGGITGVSVFTIDQTPSKALLPLEVHFIKHQQGAKKPQKQKKTKIEKTALPQEKKSPRLAIEVPKCPVKTGQHPPIDITKISCEGAFMPQPTYPKYALRKKLTGLVKVHLNLDKNGLVTSVKLISSSSHKSLDQAALKTLKTWTFPPHIAQKHPRLMAPIRFIL